jgi:hypothetical protein
MRTTIVGKACNLNISCENGDKRLLGNVKVEGLGPIHEAFDDGGIAGQSPSVEAFLSIYKQGSEALRRLLVVHNLDKRYQQLIGAYAEHRNLTTYDREGAKLFVSVMLNATDFNYFAGFIETNFFTELEYVLDLPFYAFPVDTESQSSILAKYGYILPTKQEFQSGKPCFFPNAGITLAFEHPRPKP